MKTQPKWRLILMVLALWMLPIGVAACGEPDVTGIGAEHGEEHGGEDAEHAEDADHAEDAEHTEDAEDGESDAEHSDEATENTAE